jgi:hypothetical protein
MTDKSCRYSSTIVYSIVGVVTTIDMLESRVFQANKLQWIRFDLCLFRVAKLQFIQMSK